MNNHIDVCPEFNHELIIPLQDFDDLFLWKNWQNNQEKARYLVAIFARYYDIIETLKTDFKDSTVIDKYFKQIWFYIFEKLAVYNISENTFLKKTIVNLAHGFFQEQNLIYTSFSLGNKDFDLLKKYIPLIYFLNKSLDKLSALERIILVAIDKFGWQEDKLLRYLQQYEQDLTIVELKSHYAKAYSNLINNLPTDIIAIYLQDN